MIRLIDSIVKKKLAHGARLVSLITINMTQFTFYRIL